eukprot:SAG22_NODE_1015_length_6025_cov_3.431320_4_plen_238_part_00
MPQPGLVRAAATGDTTIPAGGQPSDDGEFYETNAAVLAAWGARLGCEGEEARRPYNTSVIGIVGLQCEHPFGSCRPLPDGQPIDLVVCSFKGSHSTGVSAFSPALLREFFDGHRRNFSAFRPALGTPPMPRVLASAEVAGVDRGRQQHKPQYCADSVFDPGAAAGPVAAFSQLVARVGGWILWVAAAAAIAAAAVVSLGLRLQYGSGGGQRSGYQPVSAGGSAQSVGAAGVSGINGS